MKLLHQAARVAAVLSLLAVTSTLSALAQYRDSYPKNADIDIVSYDFEIGLSDTADSIDGRTTVTALFRGAGEESLTLDLVNKSKERDGKGMTVTDVQSDGRSLDYLHEQGKLLIRFPDSVPPGDVRRVTITYTGTPAAGLVIGPNKYGDRTFFSDNWSFRVHNWLPVVDHPYDKAMTTMTITAPSHYQVASNGVRTESTDLGNGMRLTRYSNPVPTAPWLYFIGVAEFAIEQVDTFNGIPIETWVYRQDRDKGFHDFAEPSKKVLAFYSDLVGPYVNKRLANIVSNATPGGGMEAASTPAYSDKSVTGDRSRRWQHVIIHEIAHQWFGNAVTEYHWNDVWLSEGFATYYTLLFREHLYGHDDFVQGLKDSRETVRKFYRENYDFQIVRDYIDDLNDVSGAMMYQKGAWVLHMLRDRLGEETYNEAIRSYYAEFMNGNAQTADLRRHMEAASGTDLSGYFSQWLFQGGIPTLQGTWRIDDGKLLVSLRQVQETYNFDVDVELRVVMDDGSSKDLAVHVGPDDVAEMRFEVEGTVVDVVVDPRTVLLANWDFQRE
ncbi:MAG: M1 family metallopeptidase [Rhodothermales bacterium]